MSLDELGYPHLQQIDRDLRSHIPGDPSFHAAAGAILRHIVADLMVYHPDNPANLPESERTPEQRRADELKALHEKHNQERMDEQQAAQADPVDEEFTEVPDAKMDRAANAPGASAF